MRHVKLRPGSGVDATALARLIDAAYLDMKERVATESITPADCDERPLKKPSQEVKRVTFVIKAEVSDLEAETFVFRAQKTMYGGKRIAKGDTVFVIASENEGGPGLIARGVVTSAEATPRKTPGSPGNLRV